MRGERARAHRRRSDCFVKVARAPTDGNHARFGGLESVEQARPRAGRWMEARLPVVDRSRRTSGREPQRADSTRETKRKTVATLGGNGGIRGGALPRLIVKIFRCCRHEYPLYYSGNRYPLVVLGDICYACTQASSDRAYGAKVQSIGRLEENSRKI